MAKVKFTKRSYIADPLYQWDTGQTLKIYGLSLPEAPEVHFAYEHMAQSIKREATMDASGMIQVNIPDILLQKAYKLHVWVCIRNGDIFQTMYKMVIPVTPRAKPSDYEGEDEGSTSTGSSDAATATIIDGVLVVK